VTVDLRKCSDKELVTYQLDKNDWYVRHSRRILQERAKNGPEVLATGTVTALEKIAFDHPDETRRLRGLWVLHVIGGLNPERIAKAFDDRSPYVRGWAIQLALEDGKASAELRKKLEDMARKDPSPVVRLYLASAAGRLPLEERWTLLAALVAHGEDANDHNLPLMYWYAAEPLAEVDAARALTLAGEAKIPTLLQFMIRRISSQGSTTAVAQLVKALGGVEDAGVQRAFLDGILAGLKGQRDFGIPADWPAVSRKLLGSSSAEVRSRAVALAVVFGDREAFADMRRVVTDEKAELSLRRGALSALVDARDDKLPPILLELAAGKALRVEAIIALAGFDDPKTPQTLLNIYPTAGQAEKRAIVNTLAARLSYGKALLEAVAAKKVPAADVTADVVRNLRNLRNADLDKRIGEVWGSVRTTPADRVAMIKRYRGMLIATPKTPPDLSLGRALFNKTCAQCHTLFGTGGKVGPELTGSNRANLDYLLENILDPSAIIPKEYAATLLTLTSGRQITGIVRGETRLALTVVTAQETLTIAQKDIEKREPSELSMMPDDALKTLSDDETRSLIAYLQSPVQVPVLTTADNVGELFNGKDLTGWDGDPKLWRVEKGEIVGTSPGIKRNEFLRSHMIAIDFRLTVKVKLVPNKENSGIQFRSEPLPGGEVKGPQADVGAGWWGKLYEEHGRGILSNGSGEKHVKVDDWNEYVVEAIGSRVRTWINGEACVDLDDPKISRRGLFALQIHSGGAMEVRFKEFKLEVVGRK
jgi:putative heme-binding domain-containing protein